MKAIRHFDEFIKENVVKKQYPDKLRAKFLIEESENSYKNLLNLLIPLSVFTSGLQTIIHALE